MSPRARALALALAAAAAAGGCASAPQADQRLAQARAAREALFTANIEAYQPRSPEEAGALEVLRRFKRAHDSFDARAIEALLAPSFEARHYPSKDTAEVQTRAEYLEQRRGWRARPAPARELAIAVQGSRLSQSTGQLALTALTTHRSKHFAPRFLETFVFGRQGAGWMLRRILTHPLRPPAPAFHEVSVAFVEPAGSGEPPPEAIARDMLAEGPDSVFDRHHRLGGRTRSGVRSVAAAGPFVVIFKEPPPPGARIEIVEQGYGSVTESARGTITAGSAVSPFFYIVSNDRWWGSGYTLSVRVLLDGVLVADEMLRLE